MAGLPVRLGLEVGEGAAPLNRAACRLELSPHMWTVCASRVCLLQKIAFPTPKPCYATFVRLSGLGCTRNGCLVPYSAGGGLTLGQLNVLLGGLAVQGHPKEAFELYDWAQVRGS